MNKKIVTLILVILISFCFISIAVADNATHNDNNTTHHKNLNKNQTKKNNTIDKNKTTDKNKTEDKSNNYILAKGNGNNIMFSDGFRGFILDYSKSPAKTGDKFKHASTSKASNSNSLKLAIIERYKQNSIGKIETGISNVVKTGSSTTSSNKKIGDHEVVKINNNTEAIFDFEVLQSVSGNESDYFAYKVSFRTINDDNEKIIAQANNTTNVTNMTNATNITNTTNMTNETNMTNMTNLTNITNLTADNETNATLLMEVYENLLFLANALYDAWDPILYTMIKYEMMVINAMEQLAKLAENFMNEINALMYALKKLLYMLETIWKQLNGILKLFTILLTSIQQLLHLIGSILNFIAGIISSIIAFIQQLLGLLIGLINFLSNLINQLWSLIQAFLEFLKSTGSYLIKVIENGAIIITSFVIITIGAFIYNRKK